MKKARLPLVQGCTVGGVIYEFPHLHPEMDCAICAYLAARHTVSCTCGSARPASARYGHSHLEWCAAAEARRVG